MEENKKVEEKTKKSGTIIVTEEKKKTLNEILAEDKELQSQYDRKITQALKTAKNNWEEKNKLNKENKITHETKKQKTNKIEIELKTYKLKDKTIRISLK